MIEEQFVSFDTAKMLKEAGFDAPCYMQYSERGVQCNAFYPENFNADDWGCSCPTQALATRWLREAHGIYVFSMRLTNGMWQPWYEHIAADGQYQKHTCNDTFDSYEEAFESALQEAIKLIKK